MRITTVFTDLQSSAHPIATCRPSVSVARGWTSHDLRGPLVQKANPPLTIETLAEWATDLGQTKLLEIPIFAI